MHRTMWSRLTAVLLLCVAVIEKSSGDSSIAWKWTCESGSCVKTEFDSKSDEPAVSLEACKMFCNEYGTLWPRPNGKVDLGNLLSKINLSKINVVNTKVGRSSSFTDGAIQRFKEQAALTVPKGITAKAAGKALDVFLINGNPDSQEFSLDTDESYTLRVGASSEADRVNATISANTFLGVRHGLETLSQLIVYDDIRNHVLVVRDVEIEDKPAYPYRGILLDTSRNFITIDAIKRTIDAMAAVKLNTFHWHITDSHSFPFVSARQPNLTKYGAYSPAKVYSKEAISDIVQFGLERGVRVLPEFDAPAHVGEGWQKTNLTVCFNAQPRSSYCSEPPCGQLNPTRPELYNVLEDIYLDMADVFKTDLFHMGGDEVSERCWNSSAEIQNFLTEKGWGLEQSGFLKLWNYFQTQAQEKVYKAFGKKLPLIMWTSTLTDYTYVDEYLNSDDYIIQVWTTGTDPQIQGLLKKGYKLIISNYDALYLDCGFAGWVTDGNNWCSPYIGWQKIYNNTPRDMAGDYNDQILGGEAALWTEQADSASVDGRVWPRAAALAERLWADPATAWRLAENRMLNLRERLVKMGVDADSIEPEWCYQNEGNCPL